MGEHGIPYLVLTNNSIFTARDLSARLRSSGLHVPEDRIRTSALATAAFLQQQMPGGSAFVIGEAGILTALHDAGFVTTETDPSRLPSPSFFSKDGVWVTGQVWSVNGGVVLRR